jgi:hypothetical protein
MKAVEISVCHIAVGKFRYHIINIIVFVNEL